MFYKGSEAGRIAASVMAKGVEDHDLVGLEKETTKMTDVPGLPSSAGNRLRRLRHELVLQLYLGRDPLWDAIRDVRDRWNISAEVRPHRQSWVTCRWRARQPNKIGGTQNTPSVGRRRCLRSGQRWILNLAFPSRTTIPTSSWICLGVTFSRPARSTILQRTSS
jgi:hypothetical protein